MSGSDILDNRSLQRLIDFAASERESYQKGGTISMGKATRPHDHPQRPRTFPRANSTVSPPNSHTPVGIFNEVWHEDWQVKLQLFTNTFNAIICKIGEGDDAWFFQEVGCETAWKDHIPSDLVVDRWVSEMKSSSSLDFLFLCSVWTTFGRLMRDKITSVISMA